MKKLVRRRGNVLRLVLLGAALFWMLVLSTQYNILTKHQDETSLVEVRRKTEFSGKLTSSDSSSIGFATGTNTTNKRASFLNLARRIANTGPQTAYDEEGNLGYIHDPAQAAAQYRDAPFAIPDEDYAEVCAAPGMGTDEDVDGYRALTEQVHVSITSKNNVSSSPRILCILYTYPGGHERVETIRHTWGQHCDGFLAASTVTNRTAGLVRIPHLGENATGTYNAIWQKVRFVFFHVFWNYRDDYDFFHMSGDDAFVMIENLKAYVSSRGVVAAGGGEGWPDPLYIGHWVHRKAFEYAGGGPGYTLNRAGLAGFMAKGYLRCDADMETPFEDLQFGKCYKRFMKQNPWPALDYNISSGMNDGVPLYWGYNPLVACGGSESGCSPRTIAFHHARTPGILRRWYKLLYRRGETDCLRSAKEPGATLLPPDAANQKITTKRQRLKASRMSQFQQQAKAEARCDFVPTSAHRSDNAPDAAHEGH